MVVKQKAYQNPENYLFLEQKKIGLVKRIQKQITKFELTNENLIFAIR